MNNNHGDNSKYFVSEFDVTLSMSPLQRQIVKVGWIAKDSVATYDGSSSTHMAVIARDSNIVDDCKTFYGVYDAQGNHMLPLVDIEPLWERKSITIRCVRQDRSWYINGTQVHTDPLKWISDMSELLPVIKMNQGSFSFTRIALGLDSE